MNKRDLLKSFDEPNSDILTEIKKLLEIDRLKAIISIGISYGNTTNKKLGTYSQEAVELAKNRGGDQTVIKEYGSKTIFKSGLNEKDQPTSLVPTRTFFEFISEEFKTMNRVIIAGHHYADLDAVASMLAVAHITEKCFKLETYFLVGTQEESAKKAFMNTLTKKQKLNIVITSKASKLLNDKTGLIIVDTSSLGQTPMKEVIESNAKKKKIIIIDHHRASDDKVKTLNSNYEYIDVSASSASEIISGMLSLSTYTGNEKISVDLANLLLTGIYLDTKQLSRKTTHKTLDASS
jgi:c-di-AMP phosphodiesterase-like protein